jgi:hypothetical protein
MRIEMHTSVALALFMMVLVGCAEDARRGPGITMPSSLDERQPAGSPLIPGAIPPAHATDTPPSEPPGSGLTKPN